MLDAAGISSKFEGRKLDNKKTGSKEERRKIKEEKRKKKEEKRKKKKKEEEEKKKEEEDDEYEYEDYYDEVYLFSLKKKHLNLLQNLIFLHF